MTTGRDLSKLNGNLLEDVCLYISVVEGLQYCILACPNITSSINKQCQFMSYPTDAHWVTVK